MVVGLPSSAAAPTLVLDHEEAQAADGATELPQLLQQKAQIGAEAREARGSLAQRGGGHHPDPERAPRAGEAEVSNVVLVVWEACESKEVISYHLISPSFVLASGRLGEFSLKSFYKMLKCSSLSSSFIMSEMMCQAFIFYFLVSGKLKTGTCLTSLNVSILIILGAIMF